MGSGAKSRRKFKASRWQLSGKSTQLVIKLQDSYKSLKYLDKINKINKPSIKAVCVLIEEPGRCHLYPPAICPQ